MKKKKNKKHKNRHAKKAGQKRSKSHAIVPVPPPVVVAQPLSVVPKIKQTIENLERIRRFVSQCLNIDLQRAEAQAKAAGKELDEDTRKRLEIDWGTIPGVDKPFLMQPGAEKMMKWLQLRPKFTTRDYEHPGGHLEVVSHVTLYALLTGEEVFEGPDASCTTMETNYRYVWAEAKDPGQEEKDRLKLMGMGRNKQVWKKKVQVWVWQVRIENPNIWNERNKVRQIGEKRGLVKCLRQMGAISAIFNADPSEWNIADESEDELEVAEDYTPSGRRVLVDGKSPSGKYVSPAAEREQARRNQQAVLERKMTLEDDAPHGHEPGSEKARIAEETLRRVEREDAALAAARNVTPKLHPTTPAAAPGKPAAIAKEPKPKTIPKDAEVVKGNLTRCVSGKTSKGNNYVDAMIGRDSWYRCYSLTMIPHLEQYGRSNPGFLAVVYVKSDSTGRPCIVGLKRIGPTEFAEDGRTPLTLTDSRTHTHAREEREPGAEG